MVVQKVNNNYPEPYVWVLVWDGEWWIAMWQHDNEAWKYKDSDDDGKFTTNVTHWKPLPYPPDDITVPTEYPC